MNNILKHVIKNASDTSNLLMRNDMYGIYGVFLLERFHMFGNGQHETQIFLMLDAIDTKIKNNSNDKKLDNLL